MSALALPTVRPGRMADAVLFVAVPIAAYSVLRTTLHPPLEEAFVVVAVFYGAAITAGEYLRFSIEGAQDQAPISMAAGLAFALTWRCGDSSLVPYGAVPVLGVVTVAMTVGALPHLLRRRTIQADGMAARFLGIAVTALLFRDVTLGEGPTLLGLDALWDSERWLLACAMLAVAAVGLVVHLLAIAVISAAQEQRSIAPAFRDEARAGAGLRLALHATGVLIALAACPLGVTAVPLFLLPLLLAQFALRQFTATRETYVQTVRALSRVTESAGYTRPGHADRVARLCVHIGRDLGLSARETRNLEYAALLHDIGQVALRAPIPAGATVMAAPADQRWIADRGAAIVRKTGIPAEVADAVAHQATPYRVVRERGERLPLFSRIIKVANAYDDFVGGSITPSKRTAAVERLHLGLGYEYDPRVVDSLVRVLARPSATSVRR